MIETEPRVAFFFSNQKFDGLPHIVVLHRDFLFTIALSVFTLDRGFTLPTSLVADFHGGVST